MEKIRIMFFLIIMSLLSACNYNHDKNVKNNNATTSGAKDENVKNGISTNEVTHLKLLESCLDELGSIDKWDDTKDVFYKYYYEPDSILDGN